MLRPFLSLVGAAIGSVAGLSLIWIGAAAYSGSLMFRAADPGALVLTAVGVLLVAAGVLSLAVHWVGILVVGAIHALLGMLALVVPFGNPFGGGIFSPVFQITRMLSVFGQELSDGATVFYFSGTGLVVGAFLVGAALGVRSRRLVGPSSRTAVAVSSTLGAVFALGASALLIIGGGGFVRSILAMMRYDGALAAVTVAAGVLAGLAGILLRWSSIGVMVAGAIMLAAGIYFFALPTLMPSSPGSLIWSYGLAMVTGAVFVAAAAGGTVRASDEVPVRSDAL